MTYRKFEIGTKSVKELENFKIDRQIDVERVSKYGLGKEKYIYDKRNLQGRGWRIEYAKPWKTDKN